jgi:phage host-nuclease inhibitor protein Gam
MSLFSLEEICKGCQFAQWNGSKFINCVKDNEYAVNAINGTCDTKLEPMNEPEKEEITETMASQVKSLIAQIESLVKQNAYLRDAQRESLDLLGQFSQEILRLSGEVETLTKENAYLKESMDLDGKTIIKLAKELKSSCEEVERLKERVSFERWCNDSAWHYLEEKEVWSCSAVTTIFFRAERTDLEHLEEFRKQNNILHSPPKEL